MKRRSHRALVGAGTSVSRPHFAPLFAEAALVIAFPQRDVHLDTADPPARRLIRGPRID